MINHDPPAGPHVSVIIPVLREAHRINRVIAHVREIDRDNLCEIIIADGDPEGETLRSITDEKVTRVFSPRGRGPQMNSGAARARGDILLFLHADTYLPANAFSWVCKIMDNPGYKAGAFRLGIDSPRLSFRIIEWGAFVRCRVSRVPFGDQAIFMRKRYFDEIGGFRDIPIMEDVELMKRIRVRGDRIALLPSKVRTSARRWEEEGLMSCVIRNWILRASYILGAAPETLARFYRNGRKEERARRP
ncbi:MAG TPA: TIGR04283 family arsenosugar biosynthesis glycosyltransferase [Syntrophorhabdaceae bacterium]|jgi:rSAM/selenodomain-associated transferase 2